MAKKLRTYHPKGYTRFVFGDTQIMSKEYDQSSYKDNGIILFKVCYQMVTDGSGHFVYWSRCKGMVETYLPLTIKYL